MKEYDRYISSLCDNDCPEIVKLGKEAKQSAWTLDGYTFAKSESMEDIAKATEEYYGVPACEYFDCEEAGLCEAVQSSIKDRWISVIAPEWESGRPYVIGFWTD